MNDKNPTVDLAERLEVLMLRASVVFSIPGHWAPSADHVRMAEALVVALTDNPPSQVAITAVRAIVDPADLAPAAPFWGTWLGRLLFLAGGYVHEAVPQATAAAVLDLSRQRIHQMIEGGRLRSGPADERAHRTVLADGVRVLLADKIDKAVKSL